MIQYFSWTITYFALTTDIDTRKGKRSAKSFFCIFCSFFRVSIIQLHLVTKQSLGYTHFTPKLLPTCRERAATNPTTIWPPRFPKEEHGAGCPTTFGEEIRILVFPPPEFAGSSGSSSPECLSGTLLKAVWFLPDHCTIAHGEIFQMGPCSYFPLLALFIFPSTPTKLMCSSAAAIHLVNFQILQLYDFQFRSTWVPRRSLPRSNPSLESYLHLNWHKVGRLGLWIT